MRNFGIVCLVIVLLLVFVGLPIFFTCTPTGVATWNNWFHKVQEADDDTNYKTLKKLSIYMNSIKIPKVMKKGLGQHRLK